MTVTVSAEVDGRCVVGKRDGLALALADGWRALCDPFVPMDTGRLAGDVAVEANGPLAAVIAYNAPYAARVYDGGSLHFHKDKHPLATAAWSDAAKLAGRLDALIRPYQTNT